MEGHGGLLQKRKRSSTKKARIPRQLDGHEWPLLQDDIHSSALRSCWVFCTPNYTALGSLLALGNL
jgi:hypothetical protein